MTAASAPSGSVGLSPGGLFGHGRLLTLQTVLGNARLRVESATIWEAVGPCHDPHLLPPPRLRRPLAPQPPGRATGYRIELVALADDMGLDLDALVGSPALLGLLTPEGEHARRPYHGQISEAGWLGSDGGLARLRLLLEPWFALLGLRQQAWVFHDASVPDIVDQVLGRSVPGLSPPPAWRWNLAERAAYPRRGVCVQAHESDLDFVERLLLEEGLFHWFEHEAEPGSAALGRHRLVIADHEQAFAVATQPLVPYAQGSAAVPRDGLVRWSSGRQLHANTLRWASRDDRSASLRPVGAGTDAPVRLEQVEVFEGYAYPTREHGQHLVDRRLQALTAAAARGRARGPWRHAAAGTIFTLGEHPRHDGSDAQRDRFLVLVARHRVRDTQPAGRPGAGSSAAALLAAHSPDDGAPQHDCELVLQPATLAPRPLAAGSDGLPEGFGLDMPGRQRPLPPGAASGLATAIVVGDGAPAATDRDHRVQLQFHWQRGRRSGHRLPAPEGDNAAAACQTGGWLRVATGVAGDNWGSVWTPRVGQEVLLAFAGGRHDRPLVLGVLYNGRSQEDAAGGGVAAGSAGAFASTPPWFPGTRHEGEFPGQAHGAVLSGFVTQELRSSQPGGGAGNQLVFDDSPGAERVELASASAGSRLQLGRLRQQEHNRLLAPRGHGLDLRTDAWGALRAGAGLLLSAHGRPGSQAEGRQLDIDETCSRLRWALAASDRLLALAAQHRLAGPGAGATAAALRSLSGADTLSWSGPELLATAPAGLLWLSGADQVEAIEGPVQRAASRIQHLCGGRLQVVAGGSLRLFAAGASPPDAPAADRLGDGVAALRLHAASGAVSVSADSGAASVDAAGDVHLASAQATAQVLAATAVLLQAAGASIRIGAAGIVLAAPGQVVFRASMKRFEAGCAYGGEHAAAASMAPAAAATPIQDLPDAADAASQAGTAPAAERPRAP